MLVWILFINTKRKLGLHARTLATELNLGAQADARGAKQVLDRGSQAVARGSYLSQVFDPGAQAFARGAVSCAEPRTIPAEPRSAVVYHRYLAVEPRPLSAMPFLVRLRYLIVMPRPLPAAPLAVRRTYLIVVPRPVPKPLPAATRG
jgi:hypothetical protein